MGGKLAWVGLALIVTSPLLNIPAQVVVGSVILIIGVVLLVLDK